MKKLCIFGKSVPLVAILVSILLIGSASAALLTSYGTITATVTVEQAVLMDGTTEPIVETGFDDIIAGGTKCFYHYLENQAKVPASVLLTSTFDPETEGITVTYLRGIQGSSIQVTSMTPAATDPLTEADFNNEPETLVVDGTPLDAQSGTVTIKGTISGLDLGIGWPNTAYIEIGVRPKATKDSRNAGVYMIFLADGDLEHYLIHLQDYTGHGNPLGFKAAKDLAPFTYKITLNPTGDIGGTADLVLYDKNEVEVGTNTGVEYGYSSTWEENVPGAKDEDFSEAYLFYSIIADRRGTPELTYSATVGDVKTDIDFTNPTLPPKSDTGFLICYTFDVALVPTDYTVTTTVEPS